MLCVFFVVPGAEVAQYTAIHFPDFMKKIEDYKAGRLDQGLLNAFLAFDEHLTEDAVVHQLKELAGVNPDEDEVTAEGKGEVPSQN